MIFKKLKDRPPVNQIKVIVYKVNCKTCDFTYVRESKNPGIHEVQNTSQVQDWTMKVQLGTMPKKTDHNTHLDNVEILKRNLNNRQEHLFLEALHSIQDSI